MSAAHVGGNHLPPSSYFSTSSAKDSGLVTGQLEPGDMSGREIRSEKEATEMQNK